MKNWKKTHAEKKSLRFNGLVPPGQTIPRDLLADLKGKSPAADPAADNRVVWDTVLLPKETQLLLFQLVSLGKAAA